MTRDAGDRLRPPGPVALQLAPLLGGRRARTEARDRLDGPLPRPGRRRRTTRSRDSRSTASSRRRSRPRTCRSRRSAGPATTTSGRPGVWGDVEQWMLEAFPSVANAHAGSRDPAMRAAARIADPVRSTLRQQLAAVRGTRPPEPGRLSAGRRLAASRSGSRRSRRCSAPACRCAASSLSAPGDYDTHDNQPEDLAKGLKATADALLAFQRDLEARGLADRVLVQVWSEFGRRGEENGSDGHRPRRRRGRLPDRHPGARARWSASSRASTELDEDGNLRATSDFRDVYCALLEQWLGDDAAAVIPEAATLPAARAGQVTGPGAARALAGCLVAARSGVPAHRRAAPPRAGRPARLLVSGAGVQPHAVARRRSARAGADPVPEPRRGPARPSPPPDRASTGYAAKRPGGPPGQARSARRAPRAGALPAVVLAAGAPRARHARGAAV